MAYVLVSVDTDNIADELRSYGSALADFLNELADRMVDNDEIDEAACKYIG